MPIVKVYNKVTFLLEFVEEEETVLHPDLYYVDPDTTAFDGAAANLDPLKMYTHPLLEEFKLVDGVLVALDPADQQALEDSRLGDRKAPLLDEVDRDTAAKIARRTFTHAGKEFSITTIAQIKWLGLFGSRDATTYPQSVFTKDNSEVYNIADADEVVVMYTGIFNAVKAIVDAGNVAKVDLLAATTLEDAELVVKLYIAN